MALMWSQAPPKICIPPTPSVQAGENTVLDASNLQTVNCTLHVVTTFIPGTPLKVHPASIPIQVNCISGKTHC